MKQRRILSGLLSLVVAVSMFAGLSLNCAYAVPTSAEVQAEVDAVAAKLNAWQDELDQASSNYYAALEEHSAAIAHKEEAQARIDAAQAIIDSTQVELSARANSMYREGPLSFLDVLLGASSFEEFTVLWNLLESINQDNADLIEQNRAAKQEAEEAHAEYARQEEIAATKLAEAEAIKVQAEETMAAYQAELASLEAEVAALVEQEQEAQRNREPSVTNPDGYTPPGRPVPEGGYGSVVAAAESRLGCPYVWAASGPDSFDCSGLTSWCYSQAGLGWIGRTDGSQYASAAARLPISEARPGDVLWWSGHVAIYVGGGSYIHAPSPGKNVQYSSYRINSAVVLRF